MESKHKNALIGALLAVVFVMAVGYAAFAQQLTINGSASITSNWDVHFDTSVNTMQSYNGLSGQTVANPTEDVDPTGTSSVTNLVATLHADLVQPGDYVLFTLNVKNYGTGLKAQRASAPTLSSTQGGCNGLVCKAGHIQWTVTSQNNVLNPSSEDVDVVTVKAEYTDDVTTNEAVSLKSSDLTVTLDYKQVS